jgi:DNA-binding PadR family transcriptional regulator
VERVLDLAILGLLMERDHHGYEIRAQLPDRLGLWANASFGSIYPALARLEREGLVTAVTAGGAVGGLSTGSLAGERAALRSLRTSPGLGRRGRKVYSITAAGHEAFARLLSDPTTMDDARNFALRMALARYLNPATRVRLFEQRRASLAARLDEVRRHADNPHLDYYARGVMDHGAKTVELEIDWIDSILAAERFAQDHISSTPVVAEPR